MLRHLQAEPTTPERVVVLGAKGFVGSTITHHLKAQGIAVLPLSKNDLNLLDNHATEKLLETLKPSDAIVIVSALAPCKTGKMLIDNLQMIQSVLAAIEKCPVSQVIYISSDAVYVDEANPVTEMSLKQPLSLHGMMHAARELMLKTSLGKIPLAILRPSLLYGVRDPHNGYGPNRFRRLATEKKTISLFGNGEEKRDHVYIEDVAILVQLVLEHCSQGELNIATGQSLSFRETAEIIVAEIDHSLEIQASSRQNPITHRHFSIATCQKAFPKFRFTPFCEGILKVIQASQEKVHA